MLFAILFVKEDEKALEYDEKEFKPPTVLTVPIHSYFNDDDVAMRADLQYPSNSHSFR